MAGQATRRWPKFPNFIEYANDCTTFQGQTAATLKRAWSLAFHELDRSTTPTLGIPTRNLHSASHTSILLWVFDPGDWSYESVWKFLAVNQNEFRILLDAVINRSVLPVHIKLLKKHDNHVRIEYHWINKPGGILLSYHCDPCLQSHDHMRIHDPLDGIYWSLGNFLRLGGEQRLRKCTVCQHYFVQPTACRQTHCSDACHLKDDPNRRKANAESQRRHRRKLSETLIQEDLKKVKEAKARLRALGEEDLALGWVLDEAQISRKRWASLRRWEEKEYGRPRITDLTRP
jgi:hypothetical protein